MDPQLTDVPETMLWTLHNRATEAMRDDAMLKDADAVRIYQAITYDYERSFGRGEPSHAVRSATFDQELRPFVEAHPNGVIVNLGEGLETQRYRVATSDVLWLSVDLPDAIAIREKFIEPDEKHRHLALSALDPAWIDEVPPERPVFITAQGLFMYFHEDDVRGLFQAIAKRLPGAWLMFDVIPRWFSAKTTAPQGFSKTGHYTTPPMPWGIDRDELGPKLRGWVPSLSEVQQLPYRFPRGGQKWLFSLLPRLPFLGKKTPAIVRVRFGDAVH